MSGTKKEVTAFAFFFLKIYFIKPCEVAHRFFKYDFSQI